MTPRIFPLIPALALVTGALLIPFNAPKKVSRAEDSPRTAPAPKSADRDPLDDLPPPPRGPVEDQPIDIPPPKPEVMPAEPSPEHVWISGHWEREPDSWTWVEGKWVKPPILPVRWVPGYWQHHLGRFHWVPGHWADSDEPGMIVMKPVPAPAVIEENVPPPPLPGMVWVPGEWTWNGSWTWTAGYYTERPTPLSKWVPGHWQVGLLGRWKWVPGHWSLI